jgi:hypothetical protein
VDECGITAMHSAAINGQLEAMKTLLQLSADIHAKAADAATPLHAAAATGHVDAVKTLLGWVSPSNEHVASRTTPLCPRLGCSLLHRRRALPELPSCPSQVCNFKLRPSLDAFTHAFTHHPCMSDKSVI